MDAPKPINVELGDDVVTVFAYVHTPPEGEGAPYVVVDIDLPEEVPAKVYLNDWVDHTQNLPEEED